MKEYTVEMPDGKKEYVVELPNNPDKSCALMPFNKSLEFIKEMDEFKTSDMQRYLKCGYGTVCKVLDALCALCIIEIIEGPPNLRYRSMLG